MIALPFKLRTILKVLLLLSIGVGMIIAALVFLSNPTPVSANTGDLGSIKTKYPKIAGSRLDTCNLCHTASIPSLNPYGAAYKSKGRNAAAFGLIEALDSDGDGLTNIQEINGLTFPGDPKDPPLPPQKLRLQPGRRRRRNPRLRH